MYLKENIYNKGIITMNQSILKPEDISQGLLQHGYLADNNTAAVLHYAMLLDKPVLVEGPAGAGKTELAKALALSLKRELIRLQCYEGIDENKALYEWNYQKQLLHIQAQNKAEASSPQNGGVYGPEFLLERPLLKSIRSKEPQVLLIDEIDKADEEFESFLLEILSDWQITVPELGTLKAFNIPFVILTSNNTRGLSEALRRRCLYLYLDYPNEERELAILRLDNPDLNERLGRQAISFVRRIRLERLKKHPSISEMLDWVRILEKEGIDALNIAVVEKTLNILLKHQQDIDHILGALKQGGWLNGSDRP